jgi:hypothetical protein
LSGIGSVLHSFVIVFDRDHEDEHPQVDSATLVVSSRINSTVYRKIPLDITFARSIHEG